MVLFFTLPPDSIAYPYVLVNANNPEHGLSYIKKHVGDVRKVIVDSGVEMFRDPRVKDYPEGWIAKLKTLYMRVKSLLPKAEVYATVPDYPDDYHPKSLWIHDKITNVERTVENILHATEKYPNVKWLIPIQGHYMKPRSVVRTLVLLREHEWNFGKYDYYAVANLCTEVHTMVLRHTVAHVYGWFMENLGYVPRLHVFGPKIKALPYIKRYIYSFDSMAWTRPVNQKLHRKHPYSAKNTEQRKLFFMEYLKHLKQQGVVTE